MMLPDFADGGGFGVWTVRLFHELPTVLDSTA